MLSVIYTVFGVPIMFSAFSNIGRLMTEFYCIDWFFLTSVVRRRVIFLIKTYFSLTFAVLKLTYKL